MATRKVKKNNTDISKSTPELSVFENAVLETPISDKKCKINIGGNVFDVVVKQHVTCAEQMNLMDCVEMMYFSTGSLNMAVGNALVKMNMLMLYTDLTFANDVELCNKFIASSAYQDFLDADIIPMEFYDLEEAIEKKVDYLIRKNSDSPMKTLFYSNMIDATSTIIDIVKKFDAAMDALDEYNKDGNQTDVVKMLDSVRTNNPEHNKKSKFRVVKAVEDE